MNNLIPGMTLGHFIIEQVACRHFYRDESVIRDRRRADTTGQERISSTPRTDSRTGGARRDEPRNPPRTNNCTATTSPSGTTSHTAPDLTQEQITIQKGQGLLKYTGPANTRIPGLTDVLELNGTSGLSRICISALYLGRYCRWGSTCKQKHIQRISDFTAPNKAKFLAYIQAQAHVDLAQPGTTA